MIEGIIETQLKVIPSVDGNVLHGIRSTDKSFVGFEEAYFSFINQDHVKAWKCHKKMTLNLIVPVGKVKFVFIDNREEPSSFKKIQTFDLSQNPYTRLTVPPYIWFGFKGLARQNLILNITNVMHDQKEVLRKNLNEIDFDWGL